MQIEIEEEFERFLEEIQDKGYTLGRYLDEDDYEDDYSHNSINEAMSALLEKIRTYLHENRPGEFVVSSGWCIHVMSLHRARQSRISERTIENCLVK